MPSFEDEDERVSAHRAHRATRRMRQMPPHPQHEFPHDPLKTATAGDPHSRPLDNSDPGEDEEDMESQTQRRRGCATPSVSFSEPVEAPQASRREPKAVQAAPSMRRSHNRLETRLAELQRDVANLSMRLRASSVTASQKSASFQEDDEEVEGHDEPTRRIKPTSRAVRRDSGANGERSHRAAHQSGTAGVGVAKSPARTILKKPGTTAVPNGVERTSSSRTKSRARGRVEEDGESSLYRATVSRTARAVENGHEQDDRPLRVRQSNGQPEPPKSAKEMLRVVRELRVVAVERDQLRYELDQTKRTLAALEKKAHDAAKWKVAYDKMKAHCDSLQESLELSEKIRVRQKRLLQQLQQTVQQDEAAKARTRAHASHRVDVLESVLHNTSTATMATQLPRRTTTRRVAETSQAPPRSAPTRQPTAAVNTSTRSYSRSDFDSMLQVPLPERSIAGSTMYRRTSQLKKETAASRPTTTTTRASRPSYIQQVSSTSRATKPAQTTRTNHFLAPTQSSLNHMAKRRPEATRPAFVV